MLDTCERDTAQPFSAFLKSIIVRAINGAEDAVEREERIQTALDLGVISYRTAYALRCGDDV